MKNNSIAIQTRNLFINKLRIRYLDKKQTIDEKIISLLNYFLSEEEYRIEYDNQLTINIFDKEAERFAIIIDNPIEIYRFLLETINSISFCRRQPATKKDILFERINLRCTASNLSDAMNATNESLNNLKIETF